MIFTIPSPSYKNRLLIIALGIIILVWSGLEDNQVGGVALLGWITASLSIANLILSRFGGREVQVSTLIKLSPVVGASIGALASLATALLMIFKTIRHSHVFPDYPPQLILAILERLPIWALSSGFIILGLALLVQLVYSINHTDDKTLIN
jgi:hypothetical protein